MGRPIKPGSKYITFKVPPELRQRIEEMAKRERRALSAEVIVRLERSLAQDDQRDGERLARAS